MRIFVVALLVAVALAGCSGGSDDQPNDSETDTNTDSTTTGTGSQTVSTTGSTTGTQTGGAGATNAPPTAQLNVNKTKVVEDKQIEFSINGTDEDDDELSWTFDADGDGSADAEGTDLPARVTFTYESPGVYNASLAVSDGTSTAWANVSIEVIAKELPPEPDFEQVTLELPYEFGCLHCYPPSVGLGAQGDNCVGLRAGQNNQDCAWVAVDPAWHDKPFTSSAPFDADVAFYSSCEAGGQQGAVGADGHDTGTIPPGTGCLVVWNWDVDLGGVVTLVIG